MPCSWQLESLCRGCPIDGKITCRYDSKDVLRFFMNWFPFGVTAVAGMIQAGYTRYLLLWAAYSLFFFFVWEARVLCRHCPMWAGEGRILRCHANSGVVKLWRYKPGPMSGSEKLQFMVGALLWVGFPLVFLSLGRLLLLTLIGLAAAISAVYGLRVNACTRCVNFSCPLNMVPKETMDIYLSRNPYIMKDWEKHGYRPGRQ